MSAQDKVKGAKEDIPQLVRDLLDDAWMNDRNNRREMSADLQFIAGDQWPLRVKRDREAANRPMLTLNRLPQFLHQVTNDIRQADLGIKVFPEDDESDPEMAKIFNGLIRQIQYQSSASHVFSAAAENQCGCGIGWLRVCSEYSCDTAFDQELRIKHIKNPLSVYCDPAAIEVDRTDAMWMIVTEMIPKRAFKSAYPKAKISDVEVPLDGQGDRLFWGTADAVRRAEFWRKVPAKKTLALLQDGSTIDITGKGEAELGYFPIVKTRTTDTYRVEQYIVSGAEILEGPNQWPGQYIPIIPALGSEIPLETGVYRHGLLRFARDAQQLYNFYRTATAEAIALAPKAPYIVTAAMIGKNKQQWDTLNTQNRPYLTYTPDPTAPGQQPKREHPPEVPSALMQEAQIAADDMKATTGIYDASLGNRSNETSGVAINARKLEGDVANYHYADNLKRALECMGRILVDLIPKIYDNERVVRLLGDNGDEDSVRINQVVMGVDGVPQMINDVSVGSYDIRVSIGPSYSTKRMEAANSILEFMKILPPEAVLPISGLVAKNSDWPGAEEIARILKNMTPPALLADPQDPNAPQAPDPMQDPAMQLDMRAQEADTKGKEADARKKESEADIAYMNAKAMGHGLVNGYHPDMQPPPMPPQSPGAQGAEPAIQ